MDIPTIDDAATLLALLREAPTTRVVRYVRDEDLAICESEDGDPLPGKSRGVVAWIEDGGTAQVLLNAALDADVAKDCDRQAWSELPLRHGPYCSTWVLPENPYASLTEHTATPTTEA